MAATYRVLSVCKRFRELANDEVVWKDLCLRITTRIRLQLTGGNWRKYWSIYLRDVAPINRLLVLSEVLSACFHYFLFDYQSNHIT
jgi:hypothetical protein